MQPTQRSNKETTKTTSTSATRLADYFTTDHQDCDDKWVRVEELLGNGDDATLKNAWQAFNQTTRRHLAMEEDVLFPAFEASSGMGQSGPTVVMRMEHEQIRALLDQIGFNIEEGDTDEALDLGDTLHMLIQQHNIKEEGMLYPMAEDVLAGEWAGIRQKLESF